MELKLSKTAARIIFVLFILTSCNLPPQETQFSENSLPTSTPQSNVGSENTLINPPPLTETPFQTETLIPSPSPFQCVDYQQSILLLVENTYMKPLTESFLQYRKDLCLDHYQVLVQENIYNSPEEIRAYLADLYFNTPDIRLSGVIFIGSFPLAYQQLYFEYANPDLGIVSKEFISMQYYADLDGDFSLTEEYQPQNGTTPLGEPIFNLHQGDTNWEIWVSVLPTYLDDPELTINALKRYFQKNHAYRTGNLDLPKTYLLIMAYDAPTMDDYHRTLESCCQAGEDNWTILNRAESGQQVYIDNPEMTQTEADGYQALSEGKADITIIYDHGTVGSLGRITPLWLEENDFQSTFLFNHSCSVGNLENPYAILSQILYHPQSLLLFSIGNTTDGGGLCTNQQGNSSQTIPRQLMAGKTMGEALLHHINTPLIEPWSENRENCFGYKIFFGDPTLTLRQ